MKIIELKGQNIIIDDEDEARIRSTNFYRLENGNIITNQYSKGKNTTMTLARFIMSKHMRLKRGQNFFYINGDRNDNRKCNLEMRIGKGVNRVNIPMKSKDIVIDIPDAKPKGYAIDDNGKTHLAWSVNLHDDDGDIYEGCVLLHFGTSTILKFKNAEALRDFGTSVLAMARNIKIEHPHA